jgi:hypothetical protein
MLSSFARIPVATLALLCAAEATQGQALPKNGSYNLHCPVTIRTISGPPAPKTGALNFAVDLDSRHWCLPDEGCKERYALHRVDSSSLGYSAIELVEKDAFADHENALINLDTGKLAGSSDDAPNGLINGFRTYLVSGQCSLMPYSEETPPEVR